MSESQGHSEAQQLGGKTRRGVSWSLAGAIITNATRILVLAVLGRSLTSSDFGIVATASAVSAVIYGIRDIGMGAALVQRKELEREHIATAFAISVYLGCGLALLLFLFAPQIGNAYGMPESVDVIRAMAAFFALRSVSSTSRMLAQRAMAFRLITIVDAVSFVSGSAVSIFAAIGGAGPWSLVAGYLVEETIAMACYIARQPPAFSLRIDRQRLRDLLKFGAGQTVIQSANIVATYGDNLVVGNVLGARGLGFYSRAYDLIKMPSMMFDAIVGNVLFPAFAKMQHDRARLGENMRRVAFVNALVLLPASALIVILAPEVIRLMMGPGWDDTVLPFRILALTILLRTNLKLGSILAQAVGAVNAVALAFIVYMIIVAGGAAISVQWGIVGVSITTALGITVVGLHCCGLAIAVSDLTWSGFFRAHVPGLLLAAVVTGAVLPAAVAMREMGLSAPLIVGALGSGAVLLCLIGVVIGLRTKSLDFDWLRSEISRVRSRKRT